MSCNGCRVLRKGCSESCILRPCLQWIDSAEAQGHATAFVAKFFGRAGLISFLSAVSESQRPALFQSLLFEACGRTVNPVNGAVGLLWTGNWHVCQVAVETVLLGGTLRPLPELTVSSPASDETSEATWTDTRKLQETMNLNSNFRFTNSRSKVSPKQKMEEEFKKPPPSDLDLCLTPTLTAKEVTDGRHPGTPSEESGVTACLDSGFGAQGHGGGGTEKRILNLFL
ncbi:hypothetical protein SLEP1_g11794 [Rubroshorea leprosula]|nr:hypothetical protein SLEP1_g11794 [Rubroshorea leprosula]